jgi:dihydrofolate reductase
MSHRPLIGDPAPSILAEPNERATKARTTMRKLVMQMMTTVNGRLDDPDAWATSVPDDLYAELDRIYESFDTILVGRRTYEEMLAYWPGAESDPGSSEATRSMARKMNAYEKLVFTRASDPPALEWAGAEAVTARDDGEVVAIVEELKARSGGDLHLAGGSELARTLVRLGLVDRYNLFVFPVVSPAAGWFDGIGEQRELELVGSAAYSNGVVGLHYEPR